MMMKALLASALVMVATTARAEDAPRDWDERSGWRTEVSAGNGMSLIAGRDEAGAQRTGVVGDTTIRIGFHKIRPFHGRNVLDFNASSLAWCMPVAACGGIIGILLGPESAFLGNEVGVDVAAHVLYGIGGDTSSMGFAFGARPALRVARDSRFRTASFLGSLAPEIGLAFPSGRSHEAYFELSLYPLAMPLTREVAIEWHVLRERLGVPLDGAPVTVTVGSALSFMLL